MQKIVLIFLSVISLFLLFCAEDNSVESDLIEYDYFPLHLNDTLSFSYNYIEHHPDYTRKELSNLLWVIDSIENNGNSINYSIKEIRKGTEMVIRPIDDPNNYHIDTSYSIIEKEGTFSIEEKNDSIKFISESNNSISIIINAKVKFSDYNNEILKLEDHDIYKVYLRINKGLEYYYSSYPASNNWDELEVKRIY